MRIATLLRVSPAVWLALPLALLATLYVRTFQSGIRADPYPIAVTATAMATLGFVVPVCAALAAWEGGRLRRAEWWEPPHVRSRIAVVIWTVAPVVITGSIAVGAGVLVNLLGAGILVPDPQPLALGLTIITAHSLAGFAVGVRLPLVVAAPVALLASFAWMVFLRAIEPLWLRHLNGGAIELCCGRHSDLAPAAFWGALVVAIGLALTAGLLLARQSRSRAVLPMSFGPLAAALILGSVLVSGLGSEPTVARDRQHLVCSTDGGDLVVCVWPEHVERLEEVTAIARSAVAGWSSAGLSVPSRVAEGDREAAGPDSLAFGFSLASGPTDILYGLAYAMLPPFPACAETGPYLGGGALDYVHAWFAAVAGMSTDELSRRFPDQGRSPPIVPTVMTVRAEPGDQQLRWLHENMAALRTCDQEPRLQFDG